LIEDINKSNHNHPTSKPSNTPINIPPHYNIPLSLSKRFFAKSAFFAKKSEPKKGGGGCCATDVLGVFAMKTVFVSL
jgi:hypothetical protein